jgi:thymidine phosphorylase
MSKKIAEGIDALVLDVKCGRGAFMKNRDDARKLAESLVSIGKANGVRTEALVTAMEEPLGRAVGNALEVIECLETLKGRGPADLEKLSVLLAARMLVTAGAAASTEEAETRVRDALTSGRGLEKFRQIIEQQGGDPAVIDAYDRLPSVPDRAPIRAERDGYVTGLDAELVGRATMVLGAGRDRVEDQVDPAVGAVVLAKCGQKVHKGDPLVEAHFRDAERFQAALPLFQQAWAIGATAPEPRPLVHDTVG